MTKEFALTEKGELVNGIGDPLPTRHAILTGSRTDGRAFPPGEDRTCNNWTGNGEGKAQFGHSDRIGGGNQSWNSAGTTAACSQEDLVSWGGVGLFYCIIAVSGAAGRGRSPITWALSERLNHCSPAISGHGPGV